MNNNGPNNGGDNIPPIDGDVKIFKPKTPVEHTPEKDLDFDAQIALAKTPDTLMDLVIKNGGIENENGEMVSPEALLSNIAAYISNISNAVSFLPESHGFRRQVVRLFPGHGGEEKRPAVVIQEVGFVTDNIVQLFPDGHNETIE